MLLAQSRTQTVVIGPVLDADGLPVTTAAITNFSIAKNGTASAFTTETLTHLGNSYYSIALTTSNTNSLGILAVFTNNTAWSMTVFRWNVIAASVYDAIVNNATNATGGLLTATGSVSAIAGALLNTGNLPSNFAALGINASGHVSRVTLVDTTTTNTDMRGTDGAALASNWTATRAGYLDGVLIAANYNQRTVQVTGSNHVAADVHEFQPGVITSGDFASGAITSTVLATDSITSSQIAASAVTEIQSGIATTTQLTTVEGKIDTIDDYIDTEVAAIKAKTDNLPSDPADASDITAAFTQIKGAGWSSSTDTLEKIRDASGGGGLTQADVRTAVGLASANLDTQLSNINSKTTNLPSDPADASDITAAFTQIKGAGWSSSTDTLEKIADSIGDISVDNQAIAEAVWEYLQNNEITNGSMAEILIRLWDMTELNSDGDPWFTSLALLQAPTFRLPARGRGNTVPTAPTLKVYRTQTIHDTLYVYGPDGTTPVDLRGRNLKMVFERIDGTDVGVLTDFTIIGADHNGLYFQYTSGITSVLGTRKWNLWDSDTTEMLLDGTLEIAYAAIED